MKCIAFWAIGVWCTVACLPVNKNLLASPLFFVTISPEDQYATLRA